MNKKYGAESIEILEGLEAVRVRPGMYIGSTGTKGINHLIYEIVDNSVDEHMAGFGDKIEVTLEKDGSCSIQDYGRGIPVELHKVGIPTVRVVLTVLHAGGKFNSDTYAKSGGLHGVGSSVVNALSEWLTVEVKRDGHIYKDSYEKGIPTQELTKDGNLPSIGKTKETGTKITFKPDNTIFDKEAKFKSDDIKKRLHEMCYLNPKLTIVFTDKRAEQEESVVFHEPEGLVAFVKKLNEDSEVLHEPLYYKGAYDNIEVEVAMQYSTGFNEYCYGFCNTIFTPEGGAHITGFRNAITSTLNRYARQLGVLKEKDSNFSGDELRSGLSVVIAIKHPDPKFEGQTKNKLDNKDATKVVSRVTSEQIVLYFDRNLDVLKKVLAQAAKVAQLKNKEEKAKSAILSKKSSIYDKDSKLANCESSNAEVNELFIVEGDSAGGSAKQGRNRRHQAILPLRGKVLNVDKSSEEKIIANKELISLVEAIGTGFGEGYGDDFHIDGLNYCKIIIMTDADVDGAHIRILLLTFFYRYMRTLIEDGHIFIANPPLYKVTYRKDEKYLYDDESLEEFVKRKKSDKISIQRYKGLGEMNAEQLWDTTMNPETRMLHRVTIEDGANASKMTELFMGDNPDARYKYIVENYKRANIDGNVG